MQIVDRLQQMVNSLGKAISTGLKGLSSAGRRVGVGVRWALSSGTPGGWATDHREEAAHVTGWNYVAIRAIAIQAAQSETSVYADGGDNLIKAKRRGIRKSAMIAGGDWRAKWLAGDDQVGDPLPSQHPLVRLLNRPNPTQPRGLFEYERVLQLQSTGSCLTYNVKNVAGKTVERYVIPTGMAFPEPPSVDLPRGGWRIDGGIARWPALSADPEGFTELGVYAHIAGKVIPAEDVQVTRWPHPLWKDDGYGSLAAGAKFIDTADRLDDSRLADLNNGVDPSVIITTPEGITPEELDAAAQTINSKYGGSKNKGRAMLVSGGDGVTVTPLSGTMKDMDYVQAFTQYRDACLALHGTPGIAAGIMDTGTYAALFAGLKGWTILTVQPILDVLADSDTLTLGPEFGVGLTVEHSAAAIDDPDVMERQLQTDINAGAITKGEIRKLRGRPPFGDERDKQTAGTPDGMSPAPAPGLFAAARQGAGQERDNQPGDAQGTGVADPVRQVLDDVAPKHTHGRNRLPPEYILAKAIRGWAEGQDNN